MKTYREIFFSDGVVSRYEFNPQKDITAYELSLLLPLMINKRSSTEKVGEKLKLMPVEIMRHITVIK